jgi:hypothetical protein
MSYSTAGAPGLFLMQPPQNRPKRTCNPPNHDLRPTEPHLRPTEPHLRLTEPHLHLTEPRPQESRQKPSRDRQGAVSRTITAIPGTGLTAVSSHGTQPNHHDPWINITIAAAVPNQLTTSKPPNPSVFDAAQSAAKPPPSSASLPEANVAVGSRPSQNCRFRERVAPSPSLGMRKRRLLGCLDRGDVVDLQAEGNQCTKLRVCHAGRRSEIVFPTGVGGRKTWP